MNTRLLSLSISVSICLAVSVVGADVRKLISDSAPRETQAKEARSYLGTRTIEAQTYRSPGRHHKVMVGPGSPAQAMAFARDSRSAEIADYGSHKLLAFDESGLPQDIRSLPFAVRDDLNVIFLRSGAVDTTADDAPGEFLGLGGEARTMGTAGLRKTGERRAAFEARNLDNSSQNLRLIQFVGPVKGEWLDHLRSSGIEPVAYVPNNGYLVRGRGPAVARLLDEARDAHSRGEGFIQWEAPFLNQYKIHPLLALRATNKPNEEVTVALQIARDESDDGFGVRQDLDAARSMASLVIGDAYQVMGFTNQKMTIQAGKIAEAASLPNVINIEPWAPPTLFDERAAQIVAGALTDDGTQARGPGYMNWLVAHGFSSRFGFAIDITDSGTDRGSIAAGNLHPDFLDSAGQSRVSYVRDYTSELDPSDFSGHGTINASIAAGGNTSSGAGMRDAENFNHGLGVAPFALLGTSKIFQSTGRFDLIEPYTKLISEAYRDGARISSNSWGSTINAYSIDAQEYDARVRDAVPAQPGNQEIVICFAAGNAGGDERIGSPGTGKNVVSVAASESFRKSGTDGCGIRDSDADNAMDIAFFSSGGFLDDGRQKPDIAAPGTHIQGAASQAPEFDGLLVCGEDFDKPYFPNGQTLYTWSSGTSHATPAVAGAAALARQFFLDRGEQPSAALVKALLVNTPTYMTGTLAVGDLPHRRQGWGLLNLGRTFDEAPKVFINQSHSFGDSGQEMTITGEIKDPTKPFRVTLAWTDAPGLSVFAPWVNDLDLEVTINGEVHRGNNFKGQQSQPGGQPNTKDNVEGVWLPAGTVGTFVVRVRASNIAGDGVPGNGDSTDQDFALVLYNAERKDAAVVTLIAATTLGGADALVDPGETVSMKLNLKNLSPVALAAARGAITTSTTGVTLVAPTADFPGIAPDGTGENANAFSFSVDRTVACGTTIQFVLDVPAGSSVSRVPFSIAVGSATPVSLFSDDIESGESKWLHGSGVKKKKNRVDTWILSTKRFKSGGSAWFSPNLGKVTDGHLDTVAIQLPADGRNLELVFYHTFEFEPFEFDGGVLEISSGGDFEDLGAKILLGGYNGRVLEFTDNPLGAREAWVGGRLGQFKQVVVDLSSYAGKTVVIRFRIGTDENVKGLGWYIDDVSVSGKRVACTPPAAQ
jgi:hypothetical protein